MEIRNLGKSIFVSASVVLNCDYSYSYFKSLDFEGDSIIQIKLEKPYEIELNSAGEEEKVQYAGGCLCFFIIEVQTSYKPYLPKSVYVNGQLAGNREWNVP